MEGQQQQVARYDSCELKDIRRQPEGGEQQQRVMIVAAAANGNNDDDVNAPFLVNEPRDANHNDPDLSVQRTTFNLDNRNVRITFWCIVYMIVTTVAIQSGTVQLINWTQDGGMFRTDSQDQKDNETYWSVYTFANAILWWAAAILLCSMYCTCCKRECRPCVVILFCAGAMAQIAAVGDGMYVICKNKDSGWYAPQYTAVEIGYCKETLVASSVFVVLFSVYFAFDVMFAIGDDIRVRMFAHSLFVSIRSFLFFLYYRSQLSERDRFSSYSNQFLLYSVSSAHFGLFFCCLLIMVVIKCGYGQRDEHKRNLKSLNVWFRRIVAGFLIAFLACTFSNVVVWYVAGFVFVSQYYMGAVVLIIYDLQYL